MKFVIAGLGSIGRRHLRNLAALGEKDVVLYRTHRATLPEDDLAGYPVETDLTSALKARPDGVIIANPTALHLDVAVPAAKIGCHLLLEKPVSDDLSRVAELEQAIALSGSRVLVGFQFRFHPTLQKARALIADGAIGRVTSVRAHWGEYLPGWHPWEDHRNSYAARPDLGGGVVRTLCHPLDYLRWMLGEVETVSANTAPAADVIGTEADAVADINLKFAGGALGQVHLDYIQRPGSHTLEINGTAGSLRWDNVSAELRLFRADKGEWESFPAPQGFERNQLFLAETQAFLDLIAGQNESPCTLADGIAAQRLVDAVYRAAESGRQIVL
jgi:predicted dehydrogenase